MYSLRSDFESVPKSTAARQSFTLISQSSWSVFVPSTVQHGHRPASAEADQGATLYSKLFSAQLSFLGPELRCDWGISSNAESLLTTFVFLGMMVYVRASVICDSAPTRCDQVIVILVAAAHP